MVALGPLIITKATTFTSEAQLFLKRSALLVLRVHTPLISYGDLLLLNFSSI